MDKPNITRRETFRLARFGVLLAAGLGVAENSSAAELQKGRFDQLIIKGESGGVLMKLYEVKLGNYALLKTTEIKGVTYKELSAGGTEFTIKFMKHGVTLANISDVMQKVV